MKNTKVIYLRVSPKIHSALAKKAKKEKTSIQEIGARFIRQATIAKQEKTA